MRGPGFGHFCDKLAEGGTGFVDPSGKRVSKPPEICVECNLKRGGTSLDGIFGHTAQSCAARFLDTGEGEGFGEESSGEQGGFVKGACGGH